MRTYEIHEKWDVIKAFVIERIDRSFQSEVGFMYGGPDERVIFKTTDKAIEKLLSNRFEMDVIEQPPNFLENNRGWGYFGNNELFTLKLE